MIGALLYLQFHSFINGLQRRLKRLKQPKYLAGAIVGGLYFWFYFCRYAFGSLGRPAPPAMLSPPAQYAATIESLAALALLGIIALAWVVPHRRVALGFTEAEIAFLFPAPLHRTT